MFEYGLPHVDWLVFAWVTPITAVNDTSDSFHDAWIIVSEWYLPLSFWLFFFHQGICAIPQLAMSQYLHILAKNLPDD